jgi:NodT family efflux transporter outer membrane factor (OMF) lipoprotein
MTNCSYSFHAMQKGMRHTLSVVLIAIAVTLAGCAGVGPDYSPVEPQAPEAWNTTLQGGVNAEEPTPADLAQWWTILHDPQLTSLEQRAVAGNLDLKEAQSRIREARAMRGISSSKYYPTVDAGAAATKSRSSENSGTGTTRELYAAGFDASWELDIFGGVRRSVEAAQASLEATEEDLNALQVSLLAEVALNYVDLRTYQTRLEVNLKSIQAQQKSYELNDSRFQAGIIGELAVQESLRILESTRALAPALETGLDAAKNRLAVLLGGRPGSLHAELAISHPLPNLPPTVAVGIPAETLRRRPDIRRAERNLAAQTARIGVATADLYPKFRLLGTVGLESLSAGDLFQGASKTWGFGPSVSWNLFDAGAVRRNIEVQTARQEQALIQYEQTVLSAQEEVENALFAYAREQLRREYISKATLAAARAEELARDQYQAGLVDFNNVLDTQRSLLVLRDELARSDGDMIANLVRLYKALGGGWLSLAANEEKS